MRARSKEVLTAVVLLNVFLVFSAVAFSQAPAPERTIDEIKAEAIHRAENGCIP